MKKHINTTGIPDCEFDSLARILLPKIQKLFESEEIKKEFEQWKSEQETKNLTRK